MISYPIRVLISVFKTTNIKTVYRAALQLFINETKDISVLMCRVCIELYCCCNAVTGLSVDLSISICGIVAVFYTVIVSVFMSLLGRVKVPCQSMSLS